MDAPYPADTRAKGWRFELDYEKIEQSDTWPIAAEIAMAQPALLMMWYVSWTQVPCGSLPSDENVIRAKCRIPAKAWPALHDVLMRGWWLASDGRLYHPTITARVLEMVDYREKAAARKAAWRDAHRSPVDVPRDDTGDTTGKNDTGTGTGTIEEKRTDAIASAAAAAHTDGQEAIFALGVPILTAAGVPEKNARSFLGRLRKFNPDAAIVAAIDRCAKAHALQPVEFLQGCLKTSSHFNRQEAHEQDAARVASEWAKETA